MWSESGQSVNPPSIGDLSDSLPVAVGYAEAGKWEKAVELLRPYLERHPEQEAAWVWLGYGEFNLGNFAQATAALEQAVKMVPQDARAYRLLGLAYMEMGRRNEAYQAWLTTIKLSPNDSSAAYYIGRIMVDAGRLPEAETWLQRVGSSSALNYRATYYEGLCNELLGKQTEAIKLYRASLQQSADADKAFPESYIHLGKLLVRMGLTSEAKEVLEDGVRRAPDAKLLATYGELLNQEHEYDKAKVALIRASQMDSSLPDPHYLLGQLLAHAGETSAAQKEFKRFEELKRQEVAAEEERHRKWRSTLMPTMQ